MFYLLKTEPSAYAFADLESERTTVWDGVSNPQALRNLRAMKPGDALVIYHTGDEKRAVGTASVVSVETGDPKKPVIKIRAGKRLPQPITLSELRETKPFAGSPLLRQARLSVVPLTEPQYRLLTSSL